MSCTCPACAYASALERAQEAETRLAALREAARKLLESGWTVHDGWKSLQAAVSESEVVKGSKGS